MLKTKGMRFPLEVMLVCIRWYAAYSLSTRNLEEMMEERGVLVDHSTVSRWAIRFLPLLEKVFRKYKRAVGASWRMDETCMIRKGQCAMDGSETMSFADQFDALAGQVRPA